MLVTIRREIAYQGTVRFEYLLDTVAFELIGCNRHSRTSEDLLSIAGGEVFFPVHHDVVDDQGSGILPRSVGDGNDTPVRVANCRPTAINLQTMEVSNRRQHGA
jgi:hypothetical protein